MIQLKIGILNGGGDCAGLNAVTRGAVRAAEDAGDSVVAIRRGWAGLLEKDASPITYSDFEMLIGEGGTALGTSRTNPLKREHGLEVVSQNIRSLGLDALIAVGGDDTLGVARELSLAGEKVIGVPKTIDNDLAGTDYSFGFFTAVDEAMRMIESLATTGRSHSRTMIVEVMGRDAGWISLYAGSAAGANMVLIPEFRTGADDVIKLLEERKKAGKRSSVIVVAEGVSFVQREGVEKDEFDHELIAKAPGESNASYLARLIEERTGLETRATVLGHTIRGTRPNAYDRIMSIRLGARAAAAAHGGRFGVMVAIRGAGIEEVPLTEGTKKKFVDEETWKSLRIFFS